MGGEEEGEDEPTRAILLPPCSAHHYHVYGIATAVHVYHQLCTPEKQHHFKVKVAARLRWWCYQQVVGQHEINKIKNGKCAQVV